ncbi:MAG: cyclic nucleotide-binding domain-containing protein [Gammaproteobacteria bacterium]|nr:cyclic nucleotide-binding domain-containing protein [Gammaproteobacteria bacterium]
MTPGQQGEDHFRIAIVGSGPGGLSAAARAQFHDREEGRTTPSYVLLEGFSAHAKTIQQYQKGKHVMAEPGFLDLRSDFDFRAGTRESILGGWVDSLQSQGVNIRYGADVTKVVVKDHVFTIAMADGSKVNADNVILGIGTAGNPRKLGAPGENLLLVQYQLDDPDEFRGETIIVVGAGDAAIENAIGLSKQNRIIIVNRGAEFSRAKEGNLNAVLAAINNPGLDFDCLYETTIKLVIETPDAGKPLEITFNTPEGEKVVPCDRVIARLGGVPPRKFVEDIGVTFPSPKPDAIPELSKTYETNVAGLYLIGALAGYPLIKQAMNQGYDVVEFIRGNMVKPADHPLIEYQFHCMPFMRDVDELLTLFQQRIPMFKQLNALNFRELLIESNVMVSYPQGPLLDEAQQKLAELKAKLAGKSPQPRMPNLIREGDYLYRQGEYAASFFTIIDGDVVLEEEGLNRTLERGQFFGESSLISGRPRVDSAKAGAGCILIETPRRTMVKLLASNEEVRAGVDWIFVVRELRRHFAPEASFADLREIALACPIRQFRAGEVLYAQNDMGQVMHLVRRGSVTLTRAVAQAEGPPADTLIAELRSGELVGQMALMGDRVRRESATATVATETIEISQGNFRALMGKRGAKVESLQQRVSERLLASSQMEVRQESGNLMRFLMGQGLGEATDTLIIDEALCVGCDNCEKACAETHGGISRLDRSAGATFARIHIPVACRHCEHPHCMKDCPPNALQRGVDGEVFINDSCIGCGNCEKNCPYGVIKLAYPAPKKPGLLQWILLGLGTGPGEEPGYEPKKEDKAKGKRAVKCDACINRKTGPACVAACPTGAAQRLAPNQFIDLLG